MDTYKKYKNISTILLHNAKQNYFINFVDKHKQNSHTLWSLINRHLGRNVKSSCNLNTTSDKLNDYFVESGTNGVKHLHSNGHFQHYMRNRVKDLFFFAPVVEQNLLNCTSSLPMKNSISFDLLDTNFIRKIAHNIKISLVKIINKSFVSGTVPDFTKIAEISPVFKSSDHKNYRPISLCLFYLNFLKKLCTPGL